MIPAFVADWLDLRLFGYISFRAAMAAFTAFALALVSGHYTIAWLRRHQVSENVAKTDSKDLARLAETMGKGRTPTMGGSFLVLSLLGSVLLWARLDNVHVVLGVCLTAGLAAVGFVDDYKKLVLPKSKGLDPRAKMLGQSAVVLAVLVAFAFYAWSTGRNALFSLYPPFLKESVLPLGSFLPLGVLAFIAFEWFVVVGTSNATNIADGLDGLVAGCLIVSGLTLCVFCYVTGRADWTSYLNLPHVRHASEMAVVGCALVGGCMGFLWYNAHPASVFMGDSGSLPLGGLLAWMALVAKQELVLPLIAFVFVADLASSWLQTFWYRRTGGRRLFTCAPVHHGLQLYGGVFRKGPAPWHEVKVVTRFWILAACGAMASLALLKVR